MKGSRAREAFNPGFAPHRMRPMTVAFAVRWNASLRCSKGVRWSQGVRWSVMRAVILAAGRASRMGSLAADRPKCLIELEGMTLIERQIAALRRGGINEIAVVRGYRANMINVPGVSYFANEQWAETNMVMSLAAAGSWLRSGPVIVSYGDIFYRGDLVRGLDNAPGQPGDHL